MRRITVLAPVLSVMLALGVATATPAAAASNCPPNPAAGSTVVGNINVPASLTCTLNNVLVTGGVSVGSGGYLTLVNGARVRGNVSIGSGGSLTVHNSRVDGTLNATNSPEYVNIVGDEPGTARIGNGVNIVGANGQAPAVVICGATIGGNLTIAETSFFEGGESVAAPNGFPTGVVVGGRGCSQIEQEFVSGEFPASNTIGGNVTLKNNHVYVSFVGNSIGGNSTANGNTGGGELLGNTLFGNLKCSSNSPAYTSSGNQDPAHDYCTTAP
jgi:hypothetical protein